MSSLGGGGGDTVSSFVLSFLSVGVIGWGEERGVEDMMDGGGEMKCFFWSPELSSNHLYRLVLPA